MAVKKLTKAVKAEIAKRAARELFKPDLLELWKTTEEQLSGLVWESFADFDWDHVTPYRQYINWHDEITLAKVPAAWGRHYWDDFRTICELPAITCIHLPFEYPSQEKGYDYLDASFQKRAEDILRPYMVRYFTAKKYYEDIQHILLGLNTYTQVEDVVPELAKYLPRTETEAVTALVPIEQINRIRNLLQGEVV
jgi:hypothetical protein